MLATYEKLQKDGRIGPFVKGANGQMMPKKFEEYPKFVHRKNAEGKTVSKIVLNQSEELAWKQTAYAHDGFVDPVVAERNALADQAANAANRIAELEAQLAAMRSAQAPVNSPSLMADVLGPIKNQPSEVKPTVSTVGLATGPIVPKTTLVK